MRKRIEWWRGSWREPGTRLCLSREAVEERLRGVVGDKLPEIARNQGRTTSSGGEEIVMERLLEKEGGRGEELREVTWTLGRNRQSPRKGKLTERPLETGRNQDRNMNRVEGSVMKEMVPLLVRQPRPRAGTWIVRGEAGT